LNSRNQSELGERGPGSLVLTPEGRGPDGFDAGVAEADTFEAWADVARHYQLNPDWTDVSGYSMGGFSTYRLLARWPDLFAKGFSVVDPTEDSAGVVADHAYWISGLVPRGKGDATVEVFSKGFGQGIPPVQPVQPGGGALTGGEIPALAYVSRSQSWGSVASAPTQDE